MLKKEIIKIIPKRCKVTETAGEEENTEEDCLLTGLW